MKKFKIILVIAAFILISGLVYGNPIIKITSEVNPENLINEIKEQPYILFFTLGKYYYELGNYDLSLDMFKKTVLLKPDFSPGHHNLGVLYYKKNNYDNAINEIEIAVILNNTNPLYYNSLAVIYFELNKYDYAIDNFKEVVVIDSNNPNANFDLGQSYAARFRQAELKSNENYDDLKKALHYIKKAEELEPEFPNALNNIEILESIIN